MSARTDFSVLGTQRVAQRMGVTLPEFYWEPRRVQAGLKTCRGIVIGGAIAPRMPEFSADAELLQEAVLEPRTAKPLPVLQRIAGALWRWC